MSQILRQSTQIVVHIGPFVDVTDGFTPETAVALTTADEAEIMKGGATTVTDISAATWAAITSADGWYNLTLTTSHTDTIGPLTVLVNDDSVCLPVFARFQVIEEAAYDTIFAASALPASTTNITAGTVTTATNVTTVNGLAANVITAASIATDAIGAAELAADAVTEIANAVWDTDATARQTQGTFGQAIGDPGADANTIFGAVVTGAAGATIAADIVLVQADTDDIQARLPAALTAGGNIKADVLAVSGDATAADLLELWLDQFITGTVSDVTPAAANFDTDLASATDNFYRDRILMFTSGNLAKQGKPIYSYTGVSKNAAFDEPFTEAPANGDAFVLLPLHVHAVTEISAQVWANATRTVSAPTNITTTDGEIPITAGGLVSADVTAISTDTAAANNAETAFDGGSYNVGGGGVVAASVTGATGSVTGLTTSDVGAIKTQTDKLVFTVANQVDANVQYVNDVAITGNGAGTPFNVV